MTTIYEVHDSRTCTLNAGSPCSECAAANDYEQRRDRTTLGHLLYNNSNCSVFHDEDRQCPVCEGGLAVCRLCLEYEAGLEQPCRKRRATLNTPDTSSFDDDWELAPLSRTRCVERGDAEYWYRIGGQAKEREMLLLQNADMRELLRTRKARME